MSSKTFQLPIRYLLLPLLIAIIVFVSYLFYYTGFFKPVMIEEKTAGPWTLIYKDHRGPYHKVVPTIEEVETWVKSKGLGCHESFGLYIDNPKNTDEARLRAKGGCILKDPVPTDLPEGFKTEVLPERPYVVATFTGSPGIGPLKVYPKVEDHFNEKRQTSPWPVLEIYVIHSQTEMVTTYYF